MFDPKLYEQLISNYENPSEDDIRESVLLAGGFCGEVQIGRSSLYKDGKDTVFINITIPVYDDFFEGYIGQPIEFVHLSTEVKMS